MTRITVDDALWSQLGHFTQPVELCNAAGAPVGHFVPRVLPYAEDGCPYTADELAEMRAEKGGRPLDEIWKELGVR